MILFFRANYVLLNLDKFSKKVNQTPVIKAYRGKKKGNGLKKEGIPPIFKSSFKKVKDYGVKSSYKVGNGEDFLFLSFETRMGGE